MFPPPEFIAPIARWYFSVSKRFPDFFLLIPVVGVSLGIWLIFFSEEPDDTSPVITVIGGVMCVVFYGAWMALNIVKRWRGTWDEFCDSMHSIFEE